MNDALYEYDGAIYPEYLKHGNAMQFFAPFIAQFCKGSGVDVGCGRWPYADAIPVDAATGGDAMALPAGEFDYIVSSHALEHLADPVGALLHWKARLRPGGTLFLALPHPSMRYWNTTRNRRHLHEWQPEQMARILRDLGYVDVINSERDLSWSFCCVGFNPE